jgi:hypothetical protein
MSSRVTRSGLVPERCYTIRENNASGAIIEFYLGRFVEHDGLTDSYNFENRNYGGDQLDPTWPYFTPIPCVSNSASSADTQQDPLNFQGSVNPWHPSFAAAGNDPTNMVYSTAGGGIATGGGGAANRVSLLATREDGGGIATAAELSNRPTIDKTVYYFNDPQPEPGNPGISLAQSAPEPAPPQQAAPAQNAAPGQQTARSLFGCPTRGGGCTISRKTRRKRNRRSRKSRYRRQRRM